MKHKRVFYVLTIIAYILVVLLSFSYMFSLRHVDVKFIMSTDSARIESIEKKTNSYKNNNLLFLKTSKIKKSLEKDPYVKVISVKKEYPNKIKVKVEERKEMYEISNGETKFILDENYFVLNKISNDVETNSIELEINTQKFDFEKLSVGKTFSIIQEEIIVCVNEMLSNFTDWKNILCKIQVEELVNSPEKDNFRVLFYTNQGCYIEIYKCLERGVEKAIKAYEKYCELTDLDKTKGVIICTIDQISGQAVASYKSNV